MSARLGSGLGSYLDQMIRSILRYQQRPSSHRHFEWISGQGADFCAYRAVEYMVEFDIRQFRSRGVYIPFGDIL